MIIVNEPNYDRLVDRWYQAAETIEMGTSVKMKLYEDTEKAASMLKSFMHEGSTYQAEKLANVILNSFLKHNIDKSDKLIKWIGAHTLKSGGYSAGAHESLHHLFTALKAVKNYLTIEKSMILAIPEYVDFASNEHLELKDYSIQHHEHGDQLFCDDLLNLIVENSIMESSYNGNYDELKILRQTSKKMGQLIANAFRGPLTSLNITNADQVLEYAKNFGKEINYLDISRIYFPSLISKFINCLAYLPHLDSLIAKHCYLNVVHAKAIVSSSNKFKKLDISNNFIDVDAVNALATSKNLNNLVDLNLSDNCIGLGGAKAIIFSENLAELKTLEIRGYNYSSEWRNNIPTVIEDARNKKPSLNIVIKD